MASSLFQELKEEEIKGIIGRTLGTEPTHARLLQGGLFNTTYLVDTRNCGRVVLRVGPVNRHLLMPFEHRLMETEEYVYSLCGRCGVPTSQIIKTDTTKSLIDRDFMIVRYIPAAPMCEIELTPSDEQRICRDIGIATAKMHGIRAPKFGRPAEVKSGGGFALWSEALMFELTEWERVGVLSALFTPEELAEIERIFVAAAPFLDEIREPRLVHADLWQGNILVRTDGGRPEFAAIIDADRAVWGDPDFEFSSIQWTYGKESFWEGYGRRLSFEPGALVRRAVYTLLNRLWNAYVYQCEYNRMQDAQREQADARRCVGELRTRLSA